MSETPKFEVIDRRKYKAEEEREAQEKPNAPEQTPAAAAGDSAAGAKAQQEAPTASGGGPRLVTPEAVSSEVHGPEAHGPGEEAEDAAGDAAGELAGELETPPPPTAEESREQKTAYDATSQRLEDLVRAQNPGVGPVPPVTFEQLIQQFYLSAMIQMGAGAQQGERPRVDILGAKQTIDLLGIMAEKTKGNLSAAEDRMLQSALFEARMAFLELTNMITLQGVQAPPPPAPGKR